MGLNEVIKTAQGIGGLDALARSYGLEPVQLQALLVTIAPALAQRMEANTLSRGGIADLLAEMVQPEHARVFENARAAQEPWAAAAGVRVLDTVFGDKAQSRALAARASAQTGVSQDLIQKLLPIIASIIMGAMAKGSQGGLQDILKRLPDLMGGGAPAPSSAGGRKRNGTDQGSDPDAGGLGDILARIPGMPGSQNSGSQKPGSQGSRSQPRPGSQTSTEAEAPDYGQGSPLPLPGARIPGVNAPDDRRPYEDGNDWGSKRGQPAESGGPLGDLPDIIRRGGVSMDGASLPNVVRDMLGSLLGFQSKGVMGWILRLIVMRWGWGFLRSILGRFLPIR